MIFLCKIFQRDARVRERDAVRSSATRRAGRGRDGTSGRARPAPQTDARRPARVSRTRPSRARESRVGLSRRFAVIAIVDVANARKGPESFEPRAREPNAFAVETLGRVARARD